MREITEITILTIIASFVLYVLYKLFKSVFKVLKIPVKSWEQVASNIRVNEAVQSTKDITGLKPYHYDKRFKHAPPLEVIYAVNRTEARKQRKYHVTMYAQVDRIIKKHKSLSVNYYMERMTYAQLEFAKQYFNLK